MTDYARNNAVYFQNADIFTHTMRFHPEIPDLLMPQDTFRFTVLREPSSLFESIYNFYQLNSFQVDDYQESLAQFLETLNDKEQRPELRRKSEFIGINQVSE